MVLLFGLTWGPALVVGQSWCPPGANWLYETGDPMVSSGIVQYTFAADTLVDGWSANRIAGLGYSVVSMGGQTDTVSTTEPDVLTRSNGGLVLFWMADLQEWDTLYWFGAVPGDRWNPGWDCEDGAYVAVVDTGTTMVEDIPLRTLDLEVWWNNDVVGGTTIMERVGDVQGCIQLRSPCAIWESACQFSCYRDNEIEGYPDPTATCRLNLGLGPLPAMAMGLSVWPVPFQDRLIVETAQAMRQAKARLVDLSGREVLRVPYEGKRLELKAPGLPAGLYVLQLADGQGNRGQVPVVKQ